ncbi:MAG: hypothetical protein P8M49_10520, partial [Thalassotalea sp.]|nr:hypothetical protein [Thalassotalea sp.]
MKTIKKILKPTLLTLLCGYSALSFATEIPPTDDNIFYTGRVTTDHRFAWTGSGFNVGVTQGAVSASFTANKQNAVTVLVNSVESVVYLQPGTHSYQLSAPLLSGEHSIKVFKRSEAAKGTIKLNSLTIDDEAKLYALVQPKNKFMA